MGEIEWGCEAPPWSMKRATYVTPLDHLSRDCYRLGMRRNLRGSMIGRFLWMALTCLPGACGHGATTLAHAPPRISVPGVARPSPSADAGVTSVWPEGLVDALASHGEPHGLPLTLPRDAHGRERWLAFVGTRDVATGAWHVTRAEDGTLDVVPVERFPVGVRAVSGLVESGVAYVLLESVGVLDQPANMRSVWIDASSGSSPFEASPMALSDVNEPAVLVSRVRTAQTRETTEHTTAALWTALRSASASATALIRSLPPRGAEVQLAWQSTFAQTVGHIRSDSAAGSPLVSRALDIVRATLTTRACGTDACEAWTERGHAVVRFALVDARWAIRAVIEDAPILAPAGLTSSVPHLVQPLGDAPQADALLRARARHIERIMGRAPLTATGGIVAVVQTDLDPNAPAVAIEEGGTVRLFPINSGALRVDGSETSWEASFADVDGDDRTDVVLRMASKEPGGQPLTFSQAFISPQASVQATSVEPDLPSALVMTDAPNADAAARAAIAIPLRIVNREEACRLLASAGSVAGFRRAAAPEAHVLHFGEPSLPTWRPKVIAIAKLTNDDVRGLGAHCSDLVCDARRPYCAWTAGSDSEHLWFGWAEERLQLVGAADYDGE